MDCCRENNSSKELLNVEETLPSDPVNAPQAQDDPKRGCVRCRATSRPVTRKTVFLMLKPELFERISEHQYRFCTDPECRIVYFSEASESSFTTDDLRLRVGMKEKEDPIPLCYCFGFYESDIRREIAGTGHTTVPQRIAALLKQGLCACPTRNPAGVCCLGDITKTVKRLMSNDD